MAEEKCIYVIFWKSIGNSIINVCYVDNKSFLSNFLNTNKNKDCNMKFNCRIILDFTKLLTKRKINKKFSI